MVPINGHWAKKPIKEVGRVVTGTTPSKKQDEFYGGDIPFVTPRELGFIKPVEEAATYLSDMGSKKAKIIPKNSVMVCCIGSLGKIGFAGRELATNQQINSIVFDEAIVDPRYGFRFCQTLKPLLEHIAPSTTVAIVNKSRFENLEIPVPPMAEQRRIAAILDKADNLRAQRRAALAKLDTLLQATFLDMFGDPVTNPMGWEVKLLGEVGTLERGKSRNRPRNAPELLGGPYPLIQTGDIANADGGHITKYQQTYSELGLKQSRMWKSGVLCITIAANIANSAILTFDGCFPDSVVGFLPNEQTRTEYVQHWLSFLRKIIEEKAPQVAQKNINLKILRGLEIPVPPVKLQNKFVATITSIHNVRNNHKVHLQETDNLFHALQQRAFKGQL